MYRLHAGYQLSTVDQHCCRLTDHTDSLELTAREGQLAMLLHSLTTGFTRRALYDLLDDQAHPVWSRATLWDRLGSWLCPVQQLHHGSTTTDKLTDTNLTHLAHLAPDELWARQQQVVHLNLLDEPGQQVAVLLGRQGWQTLISHDQHKISTTQTGLLFTSAHVDAQRTVVLAPLLRRINPWLNMVSAEALAGAELSQRHQLLWFCNSTDELLALGSHAAAQLPTLPIYLGPDAVTVGPWLAPDEHCLNCLTVVLGQLAGQQKRSRPRPTDPIQHSLAAIAAHKFLSEHALRWLAEQAVPEPPSATQDAAEMGCPLGRDSFLLATGGSLNLRHLRLGHFAGTCTH